MQTVAIVAPGKPKRLAALECSYAKRVGDTGGNYIPAKADNQIPASEVIYVTKQFVLARWLLGTVKQPTRGSAAFVPLNGGEPLPKGRTTLLWRGLSLLW